MLRTASWVIVLVLVTGCEPRLGTCRPNCPDAASDPTDGGVDPTTDADIDADIDAETADAGPVPIDDELDGMTLPDGVCTLGHWCWVSPAVPDAEWSDVVAVGDESGWIVTEAAVGDTTGGARVFYDGSTWRGLIGVGARLVGASAANDVWFVAGDHDVSHWNGTAFEPEAITGDVVINDIAAAAPNDAWVVGDSGVVRHWNGMEWAASDVGVDFTTDLRAIDVVAADDVWIGGTNGVIRHFDGMMWSAVDAPADFDVDAIWASADSTAVWIGGPLGARYRDTTAMAWRTPTGPATANIVSIAGTGPSAVYLLSSDANDFRALGTGLSLLSDGGAECDLRSVATYGAASYLRVGRRIAEGTGACPINEMLLADSGSPGTSPVPRALGHARSVEIVGADELLVYSDEGAYLGDPSTGVFADAEGLVPEGHDAGTIVIAASHGADELFVDANDGTGEVLHWNGANWMRTLVRAGATDVIFATADEATWAAAGNTVYAWNAATRTFAPLGDPLASDVTQLAASGATVFATHDGGATLTQYMGTTWMERTTTWPVDCHPLVARDDSTVECIGNDGRMRWVDGAVTMVDTTGTVTPFAASNLYALAGEHGWVFADATNEQVLWPDAADVWHARTSGVPLASGDMVRMRADGTTWRTTSGALLEWRP